MSMALIPAFFAAVWFTSLPKNVTVAFWMPRRIFTQLIMPSHWRISSNMVTNVLLNAIAAVRGTAFPTEVKHTLPVWFCLRGMPDVISMWGSEGNVWNFSLLMSIITTPGFMMSMSPAFMAHG